LKVIVNREKELVSSQHKFQDFFSWKNNVTIHGIVQFPKLEQLRGEMALKTWEFNLEERKRLAREVKVACINSLLAVDVEIYEIDLGDVHSLIETINVKENMINLVKSSEKNKEMIMHVNQINLQVISQFLMEQSLHCQKTKQSALRIQQSLPLVHRKVYIFEFNACLEIPKFIVVLLKIHDQCKDLLETQLSMSK